ncbi:hypothetical protein RMATCC62417_03596 [Rhizopus microsporus]|nr:hypothetical protein RMATCC62417_03596 [Rhizopus microsporus]
MPWPLINISLPDPIVIRPLPLTGLYACMLGTDYLLLKYQHKVPISKNKLRVIISTVHAAVPLVVVSPSSPANIAFALLPWFIASYSAFLPMEKFTVKEWLRSVFETFIDKSPSKGEDVRKLGFAKIIRGTIKLITLTSLVIPALPSDPEYMLRQPWLSKESITTTFLIGLDAYLIFGAADIITGAIQTVSGQKMEDMFDSPFIATSPRDFWSRRWNRHIRNLLHRQVFRPDTKKEKGFLNSPQGRGILAFAVSAAFHELIIWSVCRKITLENFCFFLLHGLACAAEVKYFNKQVPQTKLGKIGCMMGQMSFMVLTGRLFLAPFLRHRFLQPLPLTEVTVVS